MEQRVLKVRKVFKASLELTERQAHKDLKGFKV
jgi:hypothetical protein